MHALSGQTQLPAWTSGSCSRRSCAAIAPPAALQALHQPCLCQQHHGGVLGRAKAHRRRHRAVAACAAAPPVAQQQHGSASSSDTRGQRLKEWVLAHGSQPADLEPRVVDPATGQLSMVTLAPVEPGQALVRVPRALMLTAERAAADPEYGPLVREGPLSEWQALLLALLCERARGDRGFFAPYLAVLPPQDDHPLAWGPERLQWLQGSSMLDTLTARQQQVRDDCEVLQVLGANQLPTATQWQRDKGEELVTVASVTWAASILLSRAFSLDMAAEDDDGDESEGLGEGDEEEGVAAGGGGGGLAAAMAGGGWPQDVLALVPWADSLDHSSEAGPESCLRWSAADQAASLLAHQPYAPGQRVFDSYGPELSPSHLLLDWGFVDPANRNHRMELDPTAVVAPRSKQASNLLAAMVKLHTAGAAPAAALQEGGQQQGGSGVLVPVTCEGPDLTLLTWVRAALCSDAELIRAGWRVKAGAGDVELACRVMGRLSEPSSRDVEARVLGALQAHMEARLARYPAAALALARDAAAAREREEEGGHGTAELGAALPHCRAEASALLAMASEAQALMGALAAVAECQRKLQEGCALEELYLDLLADDGDDGEGEDEWEEEEEEEEEPPTGPAAGRRGRVRR